MTVYERDAQLLLHDVSVSQQEHARTLWQSRYQDAIIRFWGNACWCHSGEAASSENDHNPDYRTMGMWPLQSWIPDWILRSAPMTRLMGHSMDVSTCLSVGRVCLYVTVELCACDAEGAKSCGADRACREHCVASQCCSGVHSAASRAQLQRRWPGVRTTHSAAAGQCQAAEDTRLYSMISPHSRCWLSVSGWSKDRGRWMIYIIDIRKDIGHVNILHHSW